MMCLPRADELQPSPCDFRLAGVGHATARNKPRGCHEQSTCAYSYHHFSAHERRERNLMPCKKKDDGGEGSAHKQKLSPSTQRNCQEVKCENDRDAGRAHWFLFAFFFSSPKSFVSLFSSSAQQLSRRCPGSSFYCCLVREGKLIVNKNQKERPKTFENGSVMLTAHPEADKVTSTSSTTPISLTMDD